MPELPDLQVFARNLNKLFGKKRLDKIIVVNRKKLKVSPGKLKKALEGELLKKIYREGKEIHFEFSNGNVLGLHLMLKGNFQLFEKKNTSKHTIIGLLFDNGKGVALTDWQGAATPTLNPDKKPSPDALSKEVNYKFLKDKLNSRAIVKNLLMDQNIIRGIGNAYADEILWAAGISPFSVSNKIPDDRIRSLAKQIKSVLSKAEKQILRADPNRISGEQRDFLVIHTAKKKESPTGGKIQHKEIGGRRTYFTSEQELFN